MGRIAVLGNARPQHLHAGDPRVAQVPDSIGGTFVQDGFTVGGDTDSMNASPLRSALFGLATSTTFERMVTSSAAGRRGAWHVARRYVAGARYEDAFAVADELAVHGIAASIDLFGERTVDARHADRIAEEYVALAGKLGGAPPGTWLSLDLSHLAVATDRHGALPRLQRILHALPAGARLQIGAEEAGLADVVVETILGAHGEGQLAATVQANLLRSLADAERYASAGVPIRLVKGAYVEPPGIAVAYGEDTDLAFLSIAHRLAELQAEVLIATHDSVLREASRLILPSAPVEMLLGVRPELARTLAAERGAPVRVYVPYGPQWFRCAMRRVAESRGA